MPLFPKGYISRYVYKSPSTWWGWLMGFIQTADFCAQSAHFFSGGFVVMVASLWLEPWLAALLFFLCWSGPKEIFFDWLPFGEDHGSPDWLDLTFYTLGNGVALLALYIKGV